VAGNLEFARSALACYVAGVAKAVAQERAGAVEINREAFLDAPSEVQRRLVIAALRWVSGAEYPPRESGLNRVQAAILLAGTTTLSGCRVRADDGTILVTREHRAVASLCTPANARWDHRWHLSGPHAGDLTIRALGPDGLRVCKDWRNVGLPREILIVTPAVWRGETLVAAPLAGWPQGWTATVSPSFAATIKAH
jgi:tRNA(Ile)-lysidine synthase